MNISTPRPVDYVDGWGELIRAHRLCIGVSKRTLAQRLKMSERSLSDIEVGRRSCPPGFLDAVATVVREFDTDVDKAIRVAADGLAGQPEEASMISIEVDGNPDHEWNRAVIGRAAVKSGFTMPVLIRTSSEEYAYVRR
jgi:transcriptional regulator with XRE-family HTH domain